MHMPCFDLHHALARISCLAIVLLVLSGCSDEHGGSDPAAADPVTQATLRVIVVDDANLADAIERQWGARANGDLELRQMTMAELLDPRRKRLATDAIVYPSALIGELAERGWLGKIEDAVVKGGEFNRRDIFDLIRQHEIVWGEDTMAMPLGSPPLMLMYRRDLFQQWDLSPPQTWHEYQQLVEKLADRNASDRHATAEPNGPGWAGQLLLARAAAYARHRNYYSTLFDLETMEPRIASPPFVRALDELIAAGRYAMTDDGAGPDETRRALLSGRCAMALTWPSSSVTEDSEDAQSAHPLPPGSLAIADLPGSMEVYHPGEKEWHAREETESPRVTVLGLAGRLGSVTHASRQPQAALAMLLRLNSTEWSPQVSARSSHTMLYRDSQIPQADAWMGADFDAAQLEHSAELVRDMLRRPLWLSVLRIPGREAYLAALDDAVQRARQDAVPAQQCLDTAAEKWREITAEQGIERQQAAYVRSLGLQP